MENLLRKVGFQPHFKISALYIKYEICSKSKLFHKQIFYQNKKYRLELNSNLLFWCSHPESNRDGVLVRRILSPVRLPVPP